MDLLLLGICCIVLALLCIALLVKVVLLRKAADEIATQFAAKLDDETNVLITLSGGDRHMRRLAANINTQLSLLNRERHRFQQGDLELRGAIANISHDLRTPLTALCGYLDLLKREEVSEEATRYLHIIDNRTEAMVQLTEELFRYSVIMQSADEAVYEEVSLNNALEESISAHFVALKGRGITPEIYIPDTKILRRLDKKALSRIFDNIISNALKYSDGDLSIALSEEGEILFSNAAKDIDSVAVEKLFDRYHTVEAGRDSTGLGLSIARMLTHQMGGDISARYSEGRLSIILALGE